jgi:hypothetical protein
MRRTASEILSDLEIRIARLERQAHNSRRSPRKVGPRTLVDQEQDAQDLLAVANRAGFRSAKIQYQGDNPVVVLGRGHYIFLTDKGYEIENPTGGVNFTYKYGDVVQHIQSRGGSFGGEEEGMGQVDLTTEFNLVHDLLNNAEMFDETWTRRGDDTIASSMGDYVLTLKQTPKNIKFTLTGPYLKRGQAVATIRGMVGGMNLHERFMNFAERMADIETAATKRRSRLQAQAVKALRASRR